MGSKVMRIKGAASLSGQWAQARMWYSPRGFTPSATESTS